MKILVIDDSRRKGLEALEAARKFGDADFASSPDEAREKIPDADLLVLDFWCGFMKWPFLLRDEIRNKKVIVYSSMISNYSERTREFLKREFERIGFSGELFVSLPNPDELEKVIRSAVSGGDEFRIF